MSIYDNCVFLKFVKTICQAQLKNSKFNNTAKIKSQRFDGFTKFKNGQSQVLTGFSLVWPNELKLLFVTFFSV